MELKLYVILDAEQFRCIADMLETARKLEKELPLARRELEAAKEHLAAVHTLKGG